MGSGSRARVFAVALALTALALTLAALAGASSPHRLLPRATLHAKAAEVRSYWTPERMRNAVPADDLLAGPASPARGSGRHAAHHHKVKANPVKGFMKKPLRAHGKVFFTMSGIDYQCSGTSIRAASESMVWTAGHCVFNEDPPGGFATNWVFIPAYHGTKAPFGKWFATTLATTSQWEGGIAGLGGGDSAYDFGEATVETHGGTTLQDTVGGRRLGFFDSPGHEKLTAIGYPAAPPFTGKREQSCKSHASGRDRREGPPYPIKISCNMTGGSSGGGWIDKKGRLVSITSYGYPGLPGYLFGPYQGNAAQRLYYENGGA